MKQIYAALALLVGVAGLVIDAWVILPSAMTASALTPIPRSLLGALVYFWTYFTHLANLGLVLVYLCQITQWRWLAWFRGAKTQALMASFIALVMVFYHFMLAPYYRMEGALAVATFLLHYVTPVAYLAWWALFAGHGALRYRDIPAMLLPGVIYVAWVLIRGLWAHEYPYVILDPDKSGYAGVAIGVAIILVAVTCFSAILVLADRLLSRRAALVP